MLFTEAVHVETTQALLMCAGVCRDVTLHQFKHKRPIGQDGLSFGGYRWIFGCSVCGTFRTWGVEAP